MQVIQVELFGEIVEIERTTDGKFKRPEWLKDLRTRGSALAPKHEPILLFRKPRDGRTFARCAREFGSGGLNIEGCRVGSIVETWPTSRSYAPGSFEPGYSGDKQKTNEAPAGRWPPNVHYSHVAPDLCPTCNGAGCDDCHGEGVVGGCRRVGSKRVRTSIGVRGASTRIYGGGKGFTSATGEVVGYADSDGLETVADFACVEGCAVRALDEMAGERKSGAILPMHRRTTSKTKNAYGEREAPPEYSPASTGSASRFYPCHDWSYEIAERLAGETPFKYCAKASRGERDAGLGEFEATGRGIAMRAHDPEPYLIRVHSPDPQKIAVYLKMWRKRAKLSKAEMDKRLGTCTLYSWFEGRPAGTQLPTPEMWLSLKKILEFDDMYDIIMTETRLQEKGGFENSQPQRNTHACVKPLSLIKWLATLCLPPAQFSPRVCVPFAGSGSEAIGAVLAGWSEIHAIERECEYCEIAAARIAWWSKWAALTCKDDPAEIRALGEAAEANPAASRQLRLFP